MLEGTTVFTTSFKKFNLHFVSIYKSHSQDFYLSFLVDLPYSQKSMQTVIQELVLW